MTDDLDLVPTLRTAFVRRRIGDETVAWSPTAPEPVALDELDTVMLDILDGEASIAELATEVHEEVGIPLATAQRRVRDVVDRFRRAGLLTTSPPATSAAEAIRTRELFLAGSTPCSETAGRLGTQTLALRFDDRVVRVASDSRRAARALRAALHDIVVDDNEPDEPRDFVLTAPQGFQRQHRLIERAGFVLSDGRGLDRGLHALACHLTAFLPPAPGTVRVRVRAVVAGGATIVCLDPLLYVPAISDRELTASGIQLVDRLALDVDVATGHIANPPIPWPALAALEPGRAHVGTLPETRVVTAICSMRDDTPARVVARIAANGLRGPAADLVEAAATMVERATLHTVPPPGEDLLRLLAELRDRDG